MILVLIICLIQKKKKKNKGIKLNNNNNNNIRKSYTHQTISRRIKQKEIIHAKKNIEEEKKRK